MKNEKGFTLIELLIVVAIIGIIAAIAIPSLLRARVSANESAAIGDTRSVISAGAAYASANGGFYDGNILCYSVPSAGCIPGYVAAAPTFLDNAITALIAKQGYNHTYVAANPPAPVPTTVSPTSMTAALYGSTPATQNRTGVRGFGGDLASGVICQTPDGTNPGGAAASLPVGCTVLQ